MAELGCGHARPVTPQALPKSTSVSFAFPADELDSDQHRRALLPLTERLGLRLRTERQITRALALTVKYADGSTTTRSRTLTEPTAHTLALTDAAYTMYAMLGLQRARVRTLTLRAEGLHHAELTIQQMTFDPVDDKLRRIEEAADRARARFGPIAVRPAALALPET
ncbi:DinB/UmuC family translesion DNA polymerase [Streptomyces mesophilus]|uniref:DinB/UmuC family translesion DNA polymerase n=1 Tax=Streptomyces mesophilus TaxID=1775132 RepID=UPI0038B5506B